MIEKIEQEIDEWVKFHIGNDFQFRTYQKEAIVRIIANVVDVNGIKNHIIEAPTGSGKSLIVIIAAGVLSAYYNFTSYILCSDLYLWDQYAQFIKKHPAIPFGMIKGQSGNYECAINGQDMKNADCRMAKIAWATLFNNKNAISKGYPCAQHCEYVQARKKAIKSSVVLATYQFFLYQINVIANENNASSFGQRDIIFCDECHNIPSIVQSKMNPVIKWSDFSKFLEMYTYVQNKKHTLFDQPDEAVDIPINKISEQFKTIYERLTTDGNMTSEDKKVIEDYNNMLLNFFSIADQIQNDIADRKEHMKAFNKEDIAIYKTTTWFQNYHCVWEDFYNAVNEAGIEYMIKEVKEDEQGKKTASFSCVKENWMVWRYLMSNARYRIMLSATVGGKLAFEENIGIEYTEDKTSLFEVIPSTFNFEKSPIYFLNRYKMSYREKEKSFEDLKPIVYDICNKFSGQKGMIQTGTYDIARKLMFYAPHDVQKRMLLYDGSREKTSMIKLHQKSEDTILVGPTLCEGVDLPDDNCRFIVIMKMPYPNLKNKLVSAKVKLFPQWYNSTTSNSIIQGIGRGIRNSQDYCKTYILDACFYNLYINTKEQYPVELQQRIKLYL